MCINCIWLIVYYHFFHGLIYFQTLGVCSSNLCINTCNFKQIRSINRQLIAIDSNWWLLSVCFTASEMFAQNGVWLSVGVCWKKLWLGACSSTIMNNKVKFIYDTTNDLVCIAIFNWAFKSYPCINTAYLSCMKCKQSQSLTNSWCRTRDFSQ